MIGIMSGDGIPDREQTDQRLTEEQLHELLVQAAASGVSSERMPDIMKRVEQRLRREGRLKS